MDRRTTSVRATKNEKPARNTDRVQSEQKPVAKSNQQNRNTTVKENKGDQRASNAANKKHESETARQKPRLKVIPLGGLDAIGKNMTIFEYGHDMIIVDAGLMFPGDDHPGVDLILPDYTYVLENSSRLRAILITHGHEDHTGALPYLLKDLDLPNVVIMSSKLTLGLIEGKFKEHRIENARFREVQAGDHVAIGSFGCDFFSVNHSIPDSMGIFIRTPVGNVLHTGDFKLDQTPIDGVHTDFAAISRFAKAGVDLMLSDSTNAIFPNFTKSEAEVGKALKQIISSTDKRVIVASFSSHIHRIQQVFDAAIAAGRKVAVTGRSMLTNTKIAREMGYLKVDERDFFDAYSAKEIPPGRIVVLCTGSQGEPLSALSRMANGEHRTIEVEDGDTVIISATPVPGNEIDVTRVINALSKVGARVYDKQEALVHVSGHASAEELKLMLTIAQPKYFMPIHGEARHLRAHADLASAVGVPRKNIFILEIGDTLLLDETGIVIGEPVESGDVYVDGLSVGDISNVVLKDRQTLSQDGIVTVVCMIRKKDYHLIGRPEIIMRGVVGGDDQRLVDELVSLAEYTISSFAPFQRHNPSSLKRALREEISGLLWEQCHRRPMIIPLIMEA